ncbi:MAG: pimeloyl-[acyl-carrier protein] methyl ester esterase [Gammaproteobacteria bacterium]|nr:MAG: pimeloyl-[acyl-carrier protein] methyl ester esterase [Gammaproteobacteria bacterium]
MKPFVETIGQGPDVVMLHGWGLHGGIFAQVVPWLSQKYRVHIVDLPGFGRSAVPNQAYTMDMLTSQVLDVAPSQALWLGWSLGGMLAMHVAASHPDKVQGLITVAASPRFIQAPDWPHAMKPEVLDQFAGLLLEDYRGTLIRFLAIQTMGSETQRDDIEFLKTQVFQYGEPAPRALRGGLDILRTTDLRAQIGQITCPWLRLYGRLDGLVPVKSADDVAALAPNSQQHIFAKASHAPFISHPDAFLDVVAPFLEAACH